MTGLAWTSLSDELASQGLHNLLQHRWSAKFSKKDFRLSLIRLNVHQQMLTHIDHEEADVHAKFASTPSTVTDLLERLQVVRSQVTSGYYQQDIKTTDLPPVFMEDVKAAVREVCHPITFVLLVPTLSLSDGCARDPRSGG